ncbi:MAG: transposase [Thermaerobacter sp.]|nr:transposase [Thermaerobacter sp.]
MIVAHKIALDPNNIQETSFRQAAGVARLAYKWALDQWQQQYTAWKDDPTLPKPSAAALRRQLNSLKRDAFPWMLEVTKNAPQMAIIPLGRAFQNVFGGTGKYPTFKQKGRHDSFSLTTDQFTVKGRKGQIPKLGWGRMHEPRRFAGKVLGGTISRTANRWFLSVTVEIPDPPVVRRENQTVGGGDLGLSALATLSAGEKMGGPKAYAAAQKQLRRLPQHFSRQSPRRIRPRPAHPARDAQALVAEYAENAAALGPAACPDCAYPGGCAAPPDHRSCAALRCHRH